MISELRVGERDLTDIGATDDAAAILFRYLRAAQEGAARLNLGLLGSCIHGQITASALYADQFLYHADLLASLKREEVMLLAALLRQIKKFDDEIARGVEIPEGTSRTAMVHERILEELTGSPPFLTKEHVVAIAAATQRTGLLILSAGFGGQFIIAGPLLAEVERLIDIEGVLSRYPEQSPDTV